jgi:hypothetical protein
MSHWKYANKMYKNMQKVDLYDKGISEKPHCYEIFKLFSPHLYRGAAGYNEAHPVKGEASDAKILQKLHHRFPGLSLLPNIAYPKFGQTDASTRTTHPLLTYINKYHALIRKGYHEKKAFALVEEELTKVFEAQRDDARILRGGALAMHGHSYLDRAQRVAELESALKLQRFARDIPKFERAQGQEWLDAATESESRDSIESLHFTERARDTGAAELKTDSY